MNNLDWFIFLWSPKNSWNNLYMIARAQVVPAIKRLTHHAVEFIDGTVENFDAIILATGYKSNVPSWLKVCNYLSEKFVIHNSSFR